MLPTFETLINFPVVVKQTEDKSTDYIRIHANGVFEIVNIFDNEPYRLVAYGIDGSKDIEAINDMLISSNYSTNEEFENQLRHVKQFIPDEN